MGPSGPAGPQGPAGLFPSSLFVTDLASTLPSAARPFQPTHGYSSSNDTAPRGWVWSPTDTRAADGITAVQVTSPSTPTGRWLAQIERFICLDGVVQPGLIVHDGAISATTNLLTCATSQPFVPGDVGQPITVRGAGAGGATLVTTILSYVSPSQVHLTANATTGVTSNADVTFGPDNAAVINQAITTASSAIYVRTAILLPRGVTCTASQIFVNTHGVMLVGDCRQRGANSTGDASILALVGSATSTLKMAGAHHVLQDLWIHGGNVAAQSLECTYSGTSGIGAFTESTIENVTVSNAAPTTGIGINFTSALQINKIRFHNCNVRQDPVGTLLNGATANRWASSVKNANGNAFEISFYDCIFYNAAVCHIDLRCGAGNFQAGGFYFNGCEFYDYTGPVCMYECARHTTFFNCYTEAGSYAFLQETNNFPGFTWSESVIAINCVMGTGGAVLSLQRKQPTYVKSSELGGYIAIANSGPYWPILEDCTFIPLDYAIVTIGVAVINDGSTLTAPKPERVILRRCKIIVFQTSPSQSFAPVVSYWDHDPSQGWISPLPYQVYGNARTVTDGVTNGTTTLTSATLNLSQADVGRQIIIYSESAAIRWVVDFIATVTNPTTFTTGSTHAAATGVILNLGATQVSSEQTNLLLAANAANTNGYELRFPPGIFMTGGQNYPACTYRFGPGAFCLVTGAGASGAAVQFNGKITTDDGHNPWLGQYGATALVSAAFANYLFVGDTAAVQGRYVLNVTGNFDQAMDASGFNASKVVLTDTGAVLTTAINFTWPWFSDTPRVFYNATAKTITVRPMGATSGGVALLTGQHQLIGGEPLKVTSVLSGTVTVTNGSPNITFSTNQTITAGTLVVFAAQPGIVYQIKSNITASTAGTLVQAYSGTSASGGGSTTSVGADMAPMAAAA